MKQAIRFAQGICFSAGLASICTIPAFSQTQAVIDDGDGISVALRFDRSAGTGPKQSPGGETLVPLINANPSGGLQFYTANYVSFGKANSFNIVGSDPSLGAATTTIPTVIVPLRLTFPDGNILDGTNRAVVTANSPLFLIADYATGGTNIGVTQYGDAIQRAEFWNLPGFSQSGYHVLLSTPIIAPTVSVSVPATGCTTSVNNPGGACGFTYGAGFFGVLNGGFLDSLLNQIFPTFTANVLPIFLTDNVFLGSDGTVFTCCTLGFHNSEGPPAATAHTWIFAAYTEPETFQNNVILDVQTLSHETAEWINDPFVGSFALHFINLIPPAVLPGQGRACIPNFETGDPLEAPPVVFTQITNGTIYHLQDEAFLSWYMHSNFGVNGKYSFLGTFTTPSTLCGPG